MQFHTLLRASACLAALAAAAPALADEADSADAQTIVVTAPRLTTTPTDAALARDSEPATAPDAAAFIARLPGAALVENGVLSGQVQLRGLFGERVLLRINGQQFATGGPNAMDPAMHYAPMVLVDRMELARGISPVRDGPALAGGVNVALKEVRFGSAGGLAPQVDVTAQYRSVDDSFAVGGLVGVANDTLRLGVIASHERGDDTRFPGGRRIGGTSYDRAVYGVQAGLRTGPGELSLEYRRQETGASGNPPFAMDIVYFHTDFLRAGFKGELADNVKLDVHAHYAGVDHRMNNYSLRPAPALSATRQSDTTARTLATGLALEIGTPTRHVRLGADYEHIDKQFQIYNPNMPTFSIHPLDKARSSRVGGYAELRSGFGPVEIEAGVRVDAHMAATDAPRVGTGVPMGPTNLALAFAAADRQWTGTTVDGALRIWADLGALTPRFTLAHKTRVPSLVERFSWLPTEASGGLADGNIYVGDTQLKPERAWLVEAGLDWQSGTAYARPALFWRRINDYIQGVPYDATPGVINTPVEMVAAASGDPTPLRFANVAAELWGADVAFGAKLAGPLRLDGVASWVRGRRVDIADSLYRIAPAAVRLALGWDAARWGLSLEGEAVAAQDRVSAANSEQRSTGYVTASLHGHVLPRDGVRIDAGVENLFDRHYVEHLSGYNRNGLGDVPLGARLPGAGRSAYLRLRVAFGG
ncbi:TonB-dependent receptor [Novosphingobium sp.]|uniref:TonB-dependent receptor n=1 Tax=Novosphingobium sp. TaxID=1874826 RepID=UPI0027373981|nr:TonB-dependent receptor [Novosphingobium sp.]MDP3907030.1 TonB-dependent receptor [Novosphingobium sp.]